MTKLTRDDVLKLARLAKLSLTDKEVKEFTEELDAILQYIEQLQSVDVSGLEMTSQVTGLRNVMRPDKVKSYQASPDDLLQNVPATEERYIKVKRVIE